MPRPRVRPAFVLTISAGAGALFACAKEAPVEVGHNPPAQDLPELVTASPTSSAVASDTATMPATTATASATAARQDHDLPRNPLAKGTTVRLASNGSCFVYQPFSPLKPGEQRPPGTEPPRKAVTCPADFANDPAYRDCIDGVVLAKADSSDCVCSVGGNPPPPPRLVVCPK